MFYNLIGPSLPTVTFQPKSLGGDLSVLVDVYLLNGANKKLLTAGVNTTNSPGQPISFNLANTTIDELKGAAILFVVKPVAGHLGDGQYNLFMSAAITNPHPYEVTESAWLFGLSNPAVLPEDSANVGRLPLFESVHDIVQNQFGDGSATGSFTSSLPYTNGFFGNPGSIDVFRFWAITPGQINVKTVPQGPVVNTDIEIYRARYAADGTVSYIAAVPEVSPNLDWFPADRSQIDAQIHINDFDLLGYSNPNNPYGTGGGEYYIVVKNEQGTQGQYHIEVDAQSFPELGGTNLPADNTYPDALKSQVANLTNGPVTLSARYIGNINQFVGYFPIYIPDNHGSTLTIKSNYFNDWELNLFNADGSVLPGTVSHLNNINGSYISGSFNLPTGPMYLFLRAKEHDQQLGLGSALTLSVNPAFLPGNVAAPPSVLPALPPTQILQTDPFGNAPVFADSVSAVGNVRKYGFEAPAGPLVVNVMPTVAGDLDFRWGVYVDTTLVAWDQTQSIGGVLVPETATTTVLLPGLQNPIPDPNFTNETNPYHHVTIYLVALNNPTQGGNFTVSVTNPNPSPKPMTDTQMVMSPLALLPDINFITNGFKWTRFSVPDKVSNGVSFIASLTQGINPGNTPISYDLYDWKGLLLVHGVAGTDIINHQAKFTLTEAKGGSIYYLRVGDAIDASADVNVQGTALLLKVFGDKPVDHESLGQEFLRRLSPPPSGVFTRVNSLLPDAAHPQAVESSAFWVQNPGMAHFDGFVNQPNLAQNLTLAIYRGVGGYSGEFPAYNLYLVDYSNNITLDAQGHLALDVFLDPGMYALKIYRGNSNGVVGALVNYSLPAYTPEEVILNPQFGNSTSGNLLNVSNVVGATDLIQSFETKFYHVVAPPGALGPITALGYGIPLDYPGFTPYENNDASLSIWRPDPAATFNLGYDPLTQTPGNSGTIDPPVNPQGTFVPLNTTANPGDEFYVALNRDWLANKIGVGLDIPVPFSGDPDLVVDPIGLLPNSGQTRVDVNVRNIGYAPAPLFHSAYTVTDTSKNPAVPTTAVLLDLPIDALGSRHRILDWLPVRPNDQVSYFADSENPDMVDETNENNNFQIRTLSEVDPNRPTVMITLADPQMDGNTNPDIFGRYVHGVFGAKTDVVITMADADGNQDLYQTTGRYPFYYPAAQTLDGQYFFSGPDPVSNLKGLDFGTLFETTPQNPNIIRMIAKDVWGLPSDEVVKTIQVVQFPGWLDNSDSSLTFDANAHQYLIHFRNAVVDKGGTIDSLVGASIPFIGDKENRFLAEITADTTASLNPASPVSAPVKAHVLIEILGSTIFEQTWDGSAMPSDNFSIETNVQVDPVSLDSTLLGVTFRLINLQLFNYQSPKIPLFAYGVPGVASIQASLSFSLSAGLNAAVTIAIDPAVLNDPLEPPHKIGLASPTFIEPSITAGAFLSGDIEIFGFDIASLGGGINFTLNVGYGLPTPKSQFVDFGDFFSDACLDITGQITGEVKATVLGFTVFSYDTPPITMDFTPGCNLVHAPPVSPQQPAASGAVIPAGTDPVGPIEVDPSPSLVIDPVTGQALYVQLVDDPNTPEKVGNLTFATRTGGTWSSLTNLGSGSALYNPLVAQTHDQLGSPAVVAYQALGVGGDPALLTRNQFLTAQDIRYRYFDGTNWQAEQALPITGYDFDHSLAFNNAGQGVLSWVNNSNPAPVDANGQLDRNSNEIKVARWDAASHTWGNVQTLTNNSVADGKPATYVDENGKLYVVWVEDTPAGNQLMTSVFDGVSWGAAAALPTLGLPAGGQIGQVAIGSNGAGRIDVIFADVHTLIDPNKTVESVLFNRPSTLAGFLQPTSLETITEGATYSGIRTTKDPNGALVAYWQHANGASNEIYASRSGPVPNSLATWSTPIKLTTNPDIEIKPTLAIDTDGTYQLAYQDVVPVNNIPGRPSIQASPDVPVGLPAVQNVGTASIKVRPELSFSNPIFFPFVNSQAPSGSTLDANAQIVNHGPAGDNVIVEYFANASAGAPAKVGQETVFLAAGDTHNLSHAFTILPGAADYSVKLSAAGGVEVIGTANNTCKITLNGLANISVHNVKLSDTTPVSGQTINVTAEIKNDSDQAIGQFPVSLILGDPDIQANPIVQLATTNITLAPHATSIVTFPWTVPAAGGDFTLSVVADQTFVPVNPGVITESSELDKDAQALVRIQPNAGIRGNISSTVLNYSGVNNVQVHAAFRNFGLADLQNLGVIVQWSLDDGTFQTVATTTIPTLAAGATQSFDWIVSGLAGQNRYRVIVDPTGLHADTDKSNNVGLNLLILQGLPDLIPKTISLSDPTPTIGAPLTITTTIQNAGIASAKNFDVEIFAGDWKNGGRLIGSTTVTNLAALSSTTLSIPVNTSKLRPAEDLCVVVDRTEDVLEKSDINNELCRRVIFTRDKLTVDIVNVTPDPRTTPVQDVAIVFSQPVTGFTVSDLTLTRNGGTNILTSAATLTTVDNVHWTLGNLGGITNFAGNYTLTLPLNSGIVDDAGNPLAQGASDSFTVTTAYSIAGVKFLDSNFNRQQDVGEPGLSDWTIYLDLNNNGILNAGEPSTLTDATGHYAFNNLTPATYIVREVLRTGWVQTAPSAGFYQVAVGSATAAAPNITTRDFGNFPTTIKGTQPHNDIYVTLEPRAGLVLVYINRTIAEGPSFEAPLASLRSLSLAGGSDDDTFTLDFSNGNFIPAGGLDLDGGGRGANGDMLQLIGTPLADIFTFEPNDALIGTSRINYKGIAEFAASTGLGNDTLIVNTALPQMMMFAGGTGLDVLTLNAGIFEFGDELGQGSANLIVNVNNGAMLKLRGQAPNLAALNIAAGGKVELEPGGSRVLRLNKLAIAAGGNLDIADNSLIFQSTSTAKVADFATLAGLIKTARNNGDWLGAGLGSSVAAGDAAKIHGIAILLNDNGKGLPVQRTFMGQIVDANTVLIRGTFNGDMDLNGLVDADDYFRIDLGFSTRGKTYYDGDLDFSGLVDADDYFHIDRAFIGQNVSPIPMPAKPAAGPALATAKDIRSTKAKHHRKRA